MIFLRLPSSDSDQKVTYLFLLHQQNDLFRTNRGISTNDGLSVAIFEAIKYTLKSWPMLKSLKVPHLSGSTESRKLLQSKV